MNKIKQVAVFCSSSNALDEGFQDLAIELGRSLADGGYDLVFGGSNVGLMKIIADTMLESGRDVTGVIPQKIYDKGLGHESLSKLIVTEDMSARKKKLNEASDAFIALPGGFGTLEEILEMITLKQLQYHHKPIIFLDYQNFYQPLFELFDSFYRNRFAKPEYRNYFYRTESISELMEHLKHYEKPDFKDKWYWVGSDQFKD